MKAKAYKKQHFVPRAYLAGFADPTTPVGREPYLWVYERDADGPFRHASHKLAVKTDYYSWTTPTGSRETAVEEVLSRWETVGMPVLRDLASGRDPSSLAEPERGAFSFFVAYLEVRVPRFRSFVESFMEDLMKTVSQEAASHPESFERTLREAYTARGEEPPTDIEAVRQFTLSGEYTVDVDPLASLQTMIQLAPAVAELVYDCQWRVLEAPPGSAFITSDVPLARVSTGKLPAWAGVGWLSPWMEATLPLTPRTCLLLSLHRPEGRELVAADRVREVNLRTAAHAHEQVYSSVAIDPAALARPAGWSGWTPVTDALLPPRSSEAPS